MSIRSCILSLFFFFVPPPCTRNTQIAYSSISNEDYNLTWDRNTHIFVLKVPGQLFDLATLSVFITKRVTRVKKGGKSYRQSWTCDLYLIKMIWNHSTCFYKLLWSLWSVTRSHTEVKTTEQSFKDYNFKTLQSWTMVVKALYLN